MAFPTTSILADFTTLPAGGPPPSASFSNITGPGNGLIVDSGVCVGVAGDPDLNDTRWNTLFARDCEVWATVGVLGGGLYDNTVIGLRYTNDSTPYYNLTYSSNNETLELTSISKNGSTGSSIISLSITMSPGDSFGLRAVDDLLEIFYKPVAGSWTLITSIIDSLVSTAGYLTLEIGSNTNTVTALGGGSATVAEGVIAIQKVGQSLADVTYATVTDLGDKFLNDSACIVMLKNSGVSSVVVEAITQSLNGGLSYNNPTLTVAAGDTGAMDNLAASIFNDSSGYTHLTYTGADVLSMSIAVIER